MKKFLSCIFGLIICNTWAVEQRFDWSAVLAVPPGSDQTGGNQILHFKSLNKSCWENEDARLFVEKYLKDSLPLTSDAEVLKFGSDHVTLKGLFLELGVCTGKTINFIINSGCKVELRAKKPMIPLQVLLIFSMHDS